MNSKVNSQAFSKTISVPVTAEQLDEIKRVAKLQNMLHTQFLRKVILDEVDKFKK